jgi:hypothetical protein
VSDVFWRFIVKQQFGYGGNEKSKQKAGKQIDETASFRWDRSILELSSWLRTQVYSVGAVEYDRLNDLSGPGIYVVYDKQTPVYVGKTTRTGKTRLRELVSDWRSHTFNNKLMKEYLSKYLHHKVTTLGPKMEDQLVRKGDITREKIVEIQDQVNKFIRRHYRFAFFHLNEDLSRYEHFVIAVLAPDHND